jgi:hypothetical protein
MSNNTTEPRSTGYVPGPLPEAANSNRPRGRAGFWDWGNSPAYTAQQLRDYTAAEVAKAVAAERKEAENAVHPD